MPPFTSRIESEIISLQLTVFSLTSGKVDWIGYFIFYNQIAHRVQKSKKKEKKEKIHSCQVIYNAARVEIQYT